MYKFKCKINKIFLILGFIVVLSLISACSSTKEIKKGEISPSIISKDTFEIIKFRKNLNSLFCSGEIQIANPHQNMTGSFEMKIIRDKQLLMDIFGPFGINVARIYATKDTLLLYNLWGGKYYQTKGAIDGFEFLSPFVSKLFNLVIAEPFYDKDSIFKVTPPDDSISFSKKLSEKEYYRFNYKRKDNGMSYLSYSFENNHFLVNFSNFKEINNNSFPMKIDIYDQTNKNQMKFTFEEFKEINTIKEFVNEHKSKLTRVYKMEDLF